MSHREHLFDPGQEYNSPTGTGDVNLARISSRAENQTEHVANFRVERGKVVGGVFEIHLPPLRVVYKNEHVHAIGTISGDGGTPNTVTVSIVNHRLQTGDRVSIAGTAAYDEQHVQVTRIDKDTFSYQTSAHAASAAESAGTASGKNYDALMGDGTKTRTAIEDQVFQDLVTRGQMNAGTQRNVS